MTVKSDDIMGRSATFDAIVKGMPIDHSNSPAAFSVLLNNLRGLCLDIDLKKENESEENEMVEKKSYRRRTQR